MAEATERDTLAGLIFDGAEIGSGTPNRWATAADWERRVYLDAADAVLGSEWLREVRAKAWDEGEVARAEFTRAAYDAEVPVRVALAKVPSNPYREEANR